MNKDKDNREPIQEACAVAIADQKIAVSVIYEVELAKARIEALQFAMAESYKNQGPPRHVTEAMSILHEELYRQLAWRYSSLYSMATIHEDVRKEVKKQLREENKDLSQSLEGYLSRDCFWNDNTREEDVRKAIAIRLGYNPKALGLDDKEEE